jgi:hypothetical protein
LSELQNSGIPYVDRDSYFSYFCKNSTSPLHCLVMEKIVGMDDRPGKVELKRCQLW